MPSWFAVIPPGLEAALVRELDSLGVRARGVPGGARFEVGLEQGARLVASLRTPSSVLLELARFRAPNLDQLAARVRELDWRPYLEFDIPVKVEATLQRSQLRVRETVQGKVEHAIRDALRGPRLPTHRPGGRPAEPQIVRVRVEEDEALISLDAGGELLHRRGWREESVGAPIRENLGAALLIAAGWAPDEVLLDPFCGSGTLPIEAALMAAGRPPWTRRHFAWQRWPALARSSPPDPWKGKGEARIYGSDKDTRALGVAHENARRARVEIALRQQDVADLEPPAPTGLVVANPPYGERLGQSVGGVYVAFGRSLRERFQGWRALFLAPDPELARKVHVGAERITSFSNGGIRVGVWVVEL